MGGHAAWRKRVAAGDLAKGMGGAIMRHRPRFGRKKEDLILNRKGHIAGGNPKKKKRNPRFSTDQKLVSSERIGKAPLSRLPRMLLWATTIILVVWAASILLRQNFVRQRSFNRTED